MSPYMANLGGYQVKLGTSIPPLSHPTKKTSSGPRPPQNCQPFAPQYPRRRVKHPSRLSHATHACSRRRSKRFAGALAHVWSENDDVPSLSAPLCSGSIGRWWKQGWLVAHLRVCGIVPRRREIQYLQTVACMELD